MDDKKLATTNRYTFIMKKKETQQELEEYVIPREEAVFRMDSQGNWHNESGKITKSSIIRYFNNSIQKDENGFFVVQEIGDRREKVYFPYEETALFAIDLKFKSEGVILRLNTKKELLLNPHDLFVKGDNLYMDHEGGVIKFSERSLVKISKFLKYKDEHTYICLDDSTILLKTIES